jgi:hypothetical protein
LFLVVSTGGGLRDLSLIGNGVFVWDDDVLGTDVSVRSSGFGGELGKGSGSLSAVELGVLVSKVISLTVLSGAVLSGGVLSATAVLFLFAALWGTLERDGGDASDEGSNNEFHFS